MNKAEILVIDDEPQIRKLLEITLESNDFIVRLAENAKQGIQLAANHPPQLILLDLGLPDKSGHEVLKELRLWYDKAIIILSVLNHENDIVKVSLWMFLQFRNHYYHLFLVYTVYRNIH